MKQQHFRLWGAIIAVVLAASFLGGQAAAQTSSSENYMVDQTQFGSGSSLNSCSGSYCSKASLGDLVVGDSSSENYTAQFGAVTDGQPVLEIITLAGLQNLGVLDVDRTATASAVVKVRNYYSSGYVMQIVGNPPSQGTHQLNAITQASTSHQGAEQFGINLVANTAPEVGSDPVQVPSGEYSFGRVKEDYSTPNLFKYINGEIVALSDSSSGQTEYTVSMIINVSNVTPGGRYSADFAAVVTPIY